jgi:hypothetical protein
MSSTQSARAVATPVTVDNFIRAESDCRTGSGR